MFWSAQWRDWFLERGEAARLRHAAWLGRALRRPQAYPTIPVRPVAAGGFDPVVATAEGREWAENWWRATLERPELDIRGD